MRGRAALLVTLAVGALVAPGAAAGPACPTLADEAGDTVTFGGVPLAEDVSDITAVDISSTKQLLTVRVKVVGQPVDSDPARSRLYEVYFDTGEGSYVLRGTLGNGESRFDLVSNVKPVESEGTSANTWRVVKSIQGRVGPHAVTITAPLNRELPLLGRRVDVFARTWVSVANEVAVGGARTPQGLSSTLDDTEARSFRVGDRGCP